MGGSRYFDRRNACAKCFATDTLRARPESPTPTGAPVRAFTIVRVRGQPGIPTPSRGACGRLRGEPNG